MCAVAKGDILPIHPLLARIKITIDEVDTLYQMPGQRRVVEIGTGIEHRHCGSGAARDRMSLRQTKHCRRPLGMIVVDAAAPGPRGARYSLGRGTDVVRLGIYH